MIFGLKKRFLMTRSFPVNKGLADNTYNKDHCRTLERLCLFALTFSDEWLQVNRCIDKTSVPLISTLTSSQLDKYAGFMTGGALGSTLLSFRDPLLAGCSNLMFRVTPSRPLAKEYQDLINYKKANRTNVRLNTFLVIYHLICMR